MKYGEGFLMELNILLLLLKPEIRDLDLCNKIWTHWKTKNDFNYHKRSHVW